MTKEQIAELVELAQGGHCDLEEAGGWVPRLLEERALLLKRLRDAVEVLEVYESEENPRRQARATLAAIFLPAANAAVAFAEAPAD